MSAAALAGWVLLAGAARAQQRPVLDLTRRGQDTVLVHVRGLLSDRVIGAMESGFPLYVEYKVALRESRGLFDRTAGEWAYGFVVLWDPVRDVFVVGEPDATSELTSRGALRERLDRVYAVVLESDKAGAFYFEARLDARTLSDADVDEAFAWLRGENGDSARLRQPGLLTRTARKLLVRVAPLPRITLAAKTEAFRR